MKILKFRKTNTIEFPEDVNRIRVILNNRGYDAHPLDIQSAWEEYSEDRYCASWIILYPDDERIWNGIKGYLNA